MRAVEAYFRAYGPATPDHVRYWLGDGTGRGPQADPVLDRGASATASRRSTIDGESAYVLREHLEELAATAATTAIRLLPGYDQWVLGPGTADAHVVPPARRTLVSRQANHRDRRWSRVRHLGLTDDQVVVAWFTEAGPPAQEALAEEVSRLATILDRPLQLSVQTA